MTLVFKPTNGLGDKLLDIVAAHVIAELRGERVRIEYYDDGQRYAAWGSAYYDPRLFDFPFEASHPDSREGREETADEQQKRLVVWYASASASPPKIAEAFFQSGTDAGGLKGDGYERACALFRDAAIRVVRPNPAFIRFPPGLAGATGVHLRQSDKVSDAPDERHMVTPGQQEDIVRALLSHAAAAMVDGGRYYICSEDRAHRDRFAAILLQIAAMRGARIEILEPLDENEEMSGTRMSGYAAVRDMFYLSRCARILMGTKFSTFSVLAAIVGQVPTVNFGTQCRGSILRMYEGCFAALDCPGIASDDDDAAVAAATAADADTWESFVIVDPAVYDKMCAALEELI